MKKIKKIWRTKWQILEGIWYNHIVFAFNKKHWAIRMVKKRRDICSSCEFFDKEGNGKNVVVKGKPSCGYCGCIINELTACISCTCPLPDEPKWSSYKVKDDYILESEIETMDKIEEFDKIRRK